MFGLSEALQYIKPRRGSTFLQTYNRKNHCHGGARQKEEYLEFLIENDIEFKNEYLFDFDLK